MHAMENLAKNRQRVGENLKEFLRAVPYKVVKLMKMAKCQINTKSDTSIKAYISGLISNSCFLFIENQGPGLSIERWKRSSDVSRPCSCYWWWNVLHLLQHVFDVHKPTEKERAINSVEKSPNIPVIFLNVTYFLLK